MVDNRVKKELTVEQQVINAYQTGSSSLQDIARLHNIDINKVLVITGNSHLATVDMGGDLIDQEEAGNNATVNVPETIKVPFTLN